jgi:hypothetical protein
MKRLILITLCSIVSVAILSMAQDAASVVARPVVQAAFTVPARGAKEYKFMVPPGANSVSLEGRFVATGGPHNSIEVWVMNDDQFVNWTNRHPLNTIYDSQKVTQGTLKVALPSDAGAYHVVFNNEFSVLTPKAIEANLTLKYAR